MSTNTNWAQRGKDALSSVEDNLKPVAGSGLETIIGYYSLSPRKNPSAVARTLESGGSIRGVYAGKYTDATYNKTIYKVRTEEGLVALNSATQLDNLMTKVPEGAEVKITYNGKNTIKSGKYAGKQAHSFSVASDRQVE